MECGRIRFTISGVFHRQDAYKKGLRQLRWALQSILSLAEQSHSFVPPTHAYTQIPVLTGEAQGEDSDVEKGGPIPNRGSGTKKNFVDTKFWEKTSFYTCIYMLAISLQVYAAEAWEFFLALGDEMPVQAC